MPKPTVHRAGLSGYPSCGEERGNISTSGTPSAVNCLKCQNLAQLRYVVKCDECKRTIGETDSIIVSAEGGRCEECSNA